MNGTGSSPASTPQPAYSSNTTPDVPGEPTPTTISRSTSSGPKALRHDQEKDGIKRPSSPFQANKKIQVTASVGAVNKEIEEQMPVPLQSPKVMEEQLSPRSLPNGNVGETGYPGVAVDKTGRENERRGLKRVGEPLFLRSESTGGTEHRSNSIIRDPKAVDGEGDGV